jgi:hypothetical protein
MPSESLGDFTHKGRLDVTEPFGLADLDRGELARPDDRRDRQPPTANLLPAPPCHSMTSRRPKQDRYTLVPPCFAANPFTVDLDEGAWLIFSKSKAQCGGKNQSTSGVSKPHRFFGRLGEEP